MLILQGILKERRNKNRDGLNGFQVSRERTNKDRRDFRKDIL